MYNFIWQLERYHDWVIGVVWAIGICLLIVIAMWIESATRGEE